MTRQRLLETVARSARLKVLNELKRSSEGLPVQRLAAQLRMSYMGVKDLCVDLQKQGLLQTWRQPQKLGRPLMLYRLTERAHDLFPTVSNALTVELLHITGKIYGPAAPEKLLLHLFHQKADSYRSRLSGQTLAERAYALAHLRDAEGHMSTVEQLPLATTGLGEDPEPYGSDRPERQRPAAGRKSADGPEGALAIVEHHSLILDLLEAFPIVAKLEQEMFTQLLGIPVHRTETRIAGLYQAVFRLG